MQGKVEGECGGEGYRKRCTLILHLIIFGNVLVEIQPWSPFLVSSGSLLMLLAISFSDQTHFQEEENLSNKLYCWLVTCLHSWAVPEALGTAELITGLALSETIVIKGCVIGSDRIL